MDYADLLDGLMLANLTVIAEGCGFYLYQGQIRLEIVVWCFSNHMGLSWNFTNLRMDMLIWDYAFKQDKSVNSQVRIINCK